MPKIGRFTSDEAKADFLRRYDAMASKWPVPSTCLDVETSFGTTRVRKSGSGAGAPIVLLPGMGGNGQIWWRFIEELSRDRVVYTPDVIGWAGRCVQTAPVRDDADVANWLAETLDGLGEERVHLAGNSVGAWLALVMGVHHSERLASLTMFEPGGATFAKPRWSLMLRFILAGMRPTPERMRKMNRWLMPRFELDDEEFAAAMVTLKFRPGMPWERPLTDEQLSAVTAPLLVLFGAETVVGDPEFAAARVRAHIPSAEIETYPNIGHDLLWANPDQVIPRFLDFAASHDPVRA
ncbi:alpha/beta fold hydrolase [Nocardia pseudobrasiliensis]|uniref:Pimeloyl-ACP methyl ester carboxylesterase n=1 Tax=Nocardia pseudobrasiliensis TaxID=45979 RepID=A0A370I3W7_9NOCA|nr:alpha/beta hydrolase [Nocardia pseudobrasiliensis]RDI64821.1 pimeloyl-ACP methyl ester carboxylesterase [Nocardia pseudobrasiliensis]